MNRIGGSSSFSDPAGAWALRAQAHVVKFSLV
jgi:hypothetical protein